MCVDQHNISPGVFPRPYMSRVPPSFDPFLFLPITMLDPSRVFVITTTFTQTLSSFSFPLERKVKSHSPPPRPHPAFFSTILGYFFTPISSPSSLPLPILLTSLSWRYLSAPVTVFMNGAEQLDLRERLELYNNC